jgi:purine-binding chemotaxis protein CheW
MDLAEIRKKARPRKEQPPGDPSPPLRRDVRSTPSIQGAPEKSTTDIPLEHSPKPLDRPDAMDPLEALFRFRPEMELATEESYLQGLTGRDRQEEDLRQWLTFTLGSEEYALDIGQIREIIKPREITDLPRVPDFILGIISLRGVIIPVFDLKRRLKLGTAEITSVSRIIVCQYGEKSAGLVVDSLNQVVRLPAQGIEPPPAVLSGLDRDMVEGVGRDQGRMMILLDLANVLNAELI